MTTNKKIVIIVIGLFLIFVFAGFLLWQRISKNLTRIDENTNAPAGCPLHDYAPHLVDLYKSLGAYLAVAIPESPQSGYFRGTAFQKATSTYIMSEEQPIDLYRRYLIAEERGTFLEVYLWSFATPKAAQKEFQLESARFGRSDLVSSDIDGSGSFEEISGEHAYYHYVPGGDSGSQEWTVIGDESNIVYTFYFHLPTGRGHTDLEQALTAWYNRVVQAKQKLTTSDLCDVTGRGPIDTVPKTANKNVSTVANTNAPAEVVDTTDADVDGISASDEKSFGTSDTLKDTDGDTIADHDEIFLYFSNPLTSDTDGDGRTDREEVQAGYDPNGTTKLPYTQQLTGAPEGKDAITNITAEYRNPNMIVEWDTAQSLDGVVSARRTREFSAPEPGKPPTLFTSYWYAEGTGKHHSLVFALPSGAQRAIVLRSCTPAGECVASPLLTLQGVAGEERL